jgi:hypothetical protein
MPRILGGLPSYGWRLWHNGITNGCANRRIDGRGYGMNIQFVRLELDVCEPINRMALEARRTVSEIVNEVLRDFLKQQQSAGEHTASPMG